MGSKRNTKPAKLIQCLLSRCKCRWTLYLFARLNTPVPYVLTNQYLLRLNAPFQPGQIILARGHLGSVSWSNLSPVS